MFKLNLHLFAITTTLTLTTFGITTQQEIEDWICKTAGYITAIQQNTYGCPHYIECYSDISPSLTLETPPPISQKSENNFLKYSREANEAECQIAGIDNLRIIDFDSIVNGFDPELKAYAIKLSQNDTFLQEELDKWIQNREILTSINIYNWKTYQSQEGFYKISKTVENRYKKTLKQKMQTLCQHDVSRQVVCLTLCMDIFASRPLSFELGRAPNPECIRYERLRNAITDDMPFTIPFSLCLCHELKHMIHENLGIVSSYKLYDNFTGNFERNLFQLENYFENFPETIQLSKRTYNGIFEGLIRWIEKDEILSTNTQKLFDYAQISKDWSDLDEVFNIIGFAKVGNDIYVNRLSDFDMYKTPRWGHGKFNPTENLESEPSETPGIFETLQEIYKQDITVPNETYWDIWCKLHNRVNIDYFCYRTISDIEVCLQKMIFKD